jgi:hypothetical protein
VTVAPGVAISRRFADSGRYVLVGLASPADRRGLRVDAYQRRSRAIWFLAALVLLLPSSSVFPAADLAADRRMYLPLLAVAAALALTVPKLEYAVVVLIALSGLRTRDWLDAERFWRKQASGGSVRSLVQLARVLEPSEAAGLLEQAKGKSPEDPLIASELGRVY